MSFSVSTDYEPSRQDTILGIFLLITILIGVSFLWLRYSSAQSYQWHEFYTELTNSFGILSGATVSFRGVSIGEIKQVSITNQGLVRVDLSLDNSFEEFYTEGSYLEIKSELGLDTVLSGAGFSFISAGTDKPLIPSGTLLTTKEPQSFQDLLEQWNAKALVNQVSNIVSNLDTLVNNIGANEQKFQDTLDNMNRFSQSIFNASQQLPDVISNTNQAALEVSKLLILLDQDIDEKSAEVSELIQVITHLVRDVNQLSSGLEPAVDGSSDAVENFSLATIKLNILIDKLNRHWLLSDSKNDKNTNGAVALPSDMYLRNIDPETEKSDDN